MASFLPSNESITTGITTKPGDLLSKSLELLSNTYEIENQIIHGYSTVLFVGSSFSGKTSIIERFMAICNNEKFLDSNRSKYEETIALKYRFIRKRTLDYRRQVSEIEQQLGGKLANIWELGNGTLFLNLIPFCLNKDTIRMTTIGVVVDLTRPNQMVELLETLTSTLNNIIEEIFHECEPSLKNTIIDEAQKRTMLYDRRKQTETNTAPEVRKSSSKPFPIPLVIIGSKYDEFQNMDPEVKKQIVRYLRTFACVQSAQLIFVSNKSETLMKRLFHSLEPVVFDRSTLFSNHYHEVEPTSKQTISTNFTKPLMIPFGYDSLQRIGVTSMDEVRNEFIGMFPQESLNYETSIVTDPRSDPNFAEAEIDKILEYKYMMLKPTTK